MPFHNYRSLRLGLVSGSLACLALIAFGLMRYLQVTSSPGIHLAYAAGIILVTSLPGIVGLAYTRPRWPGAILAIERGAPLGRVLGIIWVFQIMAARLALAITERQPVGLGLIAIAGIGTILLAAGSAYLTSRRTGNILTGLQVGLWGAVISSLMAFLTVMVLTYLLSESRLGETQVALAFQESGESNPAAWFFWDQLSGAASYLVLSGGLCLSSGLLGGLAGLIWYRP